MAIPKHFVVILPEIDGVRKKLYLASYARNTVKDVEELVSSRPGVPFHVYENKEGLNDPLYSTDVTRELYKRLAITYGLPLDQLGNITV